MNIANEFDRLAHRYPLQFGRVSVSQFLIEFVKRFMKVRVIGLAAEMTYYALLSIFPLLTAIGASLGFLQRFAGEARINQIEAAIVSSLGLVFSSEVTRNIINPLVQGLLTQERAGFAVGGLVVSLFLASRVFRSAIDTLDAAYGVEERRGLFAVWWRGFLFALFAIITIITIMSMVVLGPLLGGGRAIAEWFGLGGIFEWFWDIARWPVVFAVASGFLATLYRVGPNVKNEWRQSFPGAIAGVIALILVAVGFSAYLQIVGTTTPGLATRDEAVEVALQTVGAGLAALLWIWLSSIVVLAGGVFNAELSRLKREMPPPDA